MTIIQGDFGSAAARVAEDDAKKEAAPIYQLHISLAFSDPLIWRRIQVPGEMTLQQFHGVMQICMGWSGAYNHQFYVGKIFYEKGESGKGKKERYNEADYNLHALEEAMRWCFTYMYDAGDGWEHDIVLEEILPPESGEKTAVLIDGEWAAPPEEVGSVHTYQDVIGAIENPGAAGSKSIIEQYVPPGFDPAYFAIREMNEKLQKYGKAV